MREDTKQRTEISSLGEFGLIDQLTRSFNTRQSSTVFGVGDDAAVVDHRSGLTVVSTDMLVEGIHFDLMYSPLKHLGYKAVVVNLSDIYAMNAHPYQITVSVGISNRFSVEAMQELYAGIQAACEHYGVDLIGGDTTSSNRGLIISVTALGLAQADRLAYRNGAKEGDLICITGNVGAAYLGLQLLEREKQLFLSDQNIKPDLEDQAYLVGRQLKPEARKDMIDAFAQNDLVPTAMIDVSDGVASELHHICRASGVGALIEETGLPIHPDAKLQALAFNLDPTTCALSGGEDYELLFTIDPKDTDKVRFLPDIYILGEIVAAADGIRLHTSHGKLHELESLGWKHV